MIIFCLFLVDGKTVSTFEEKKDLTLPAREKPEKSVRLMREQGMLRKYWYYIPVEKNCQSNYLILILPLIFNGNTKPLQIESSHTTVKKALIPKKHNDRKKSRRYTYVMFLTPSWYWIIE